MRLIDADDLYQKCIEIQLKKRNRYFDIDDVIKLIKKAPTVDVLDKIRSEIDGIEINGRVDEHIMFVRTAEQVKGMTLEIIDRHIVERSEDVKRTNN